MSQAGVPFDDEENALNEQGMEALPPVQPLGGGAGYTEILGQPAAPITGRATSPPLYAQAALHPAVVQLRVWQVVNGIPTGLGVIEATATEEDLIRKWPGAMPLTAADPPMHFKLRPVDANGLPTGQEFPVYVNANHEVLVRMRQAAAGAAATAAAGTPGAMPPEVVGLVDRLTMHSLKMVEEERKRADEILQRGAQERVDLASNATAGLQTVTEKLMEAESRRAAQALSAEQERNRQAQEATSSFFQTQMEAARAEREEAARAWERRMESERQERLSALERERQQREEDLARARQRAAEDRADAEARRRAEQEEATTRTRMLMDEIEVRRQRDRDQAAFELRKLEIDQQARDAAREREAREREAERARQHDLRLKEIEVAAARDREHNERMMQLQMQAAQQQHGSSLEGALAKALGFAKMLGVEPSDVLGFVKNVLSPAAGETGPSPWAEVAASVVKAGGDVVKEAIKARKAPEQAPPMMPMVPGMPYPMLAGPQGYVPVALPPGAAAGAAPYSPPNGSEDEEEDDEGEGVGGTSPMLGAELPLTVQKAARVALRNLVVRMRSLAPEKWSEAVAQALTAEPAIYHYVSIVTVRAALIEAGGDASMVQRVIELLRASGMVPEGLRLE